jgi:hypothetical protein
MQTAKMKERSNLILTGPKKQEPIVGSGGMLKVGSSRLCSQVATPSVPFPSRELFPVASTQMLAPTASSIEA